LADLFSQNTLLDYYQEKSCCQGNKRIVFAYYNKKNSGGICKKYLVLYAFQWVFLQKEPLFLSMKGNKTLIVFKSFQV